MSSLTTAQTGFRGFFFQELVGGVPLTAHAW